VQVTLGDAVLRVGLRLLPGLPPGVAAAPAGHPEVAPGEAPDRVEVSKP
jgi:hypothetical protein